MPPGCRFTRPKCKFCRLTSRDTHTARLRLMTCHDASNVRPAGGGAAPPPIGTVTGNFCFIPFLCYLQRERRPEPGGAAGKPEWTLYTKVYSGGCLQHSASASYLRWPSCCFRLRLQRVAQRAIAGCNLPAPRSQSAGKRTLKRWPAQVARVPGPKQMHAAVPC